jgi:Cu/Ag efflux pump CusA
VRLVAQRAGRAEQGDDVFGTHYSEFEVDLGQTDAEEQEETETKIRAALQKIPGATFAVMTFLSDRLDEVVSGFTAPVVIRAYGNNLDELDETANRIAAAVSSVDQAVDVQQQNPPGIPKLIVRLHQEALLRWGFNALDVLDAIRTAYQGVPVGQIYEGDRVFNAAVLLAPNLRKRPEAVSGLLLKSDEGVFVPLRELAQIDMTSSRYGVLHEGGRRVQIITADTTDSDVGAFSLRVKKAIAALSLPTGITIEYAGAAEAQSQSMRTLLIHSTIAAVGMLLLLSLSVPRIRNLGLIFLNLPFAMVGGILALLASGGVASLGALVGFVTLFGITLRNGIMMISHYSYLATAEDMPWTLDTAIEGAADRLSPILMTSLATALGLLPLALGSGEPGRELEGPMAIVILGGLVSSAILNLLILPGLALRFGRFTTKTS